MADIFPLLLFLTLNTSPNVPELMSDISLNSRSYLPLLSISKLYEYNKTISLCLDYIVFGNNILKRVCDR